MASADPWARLLEEHGPALLLYARQFIADRAAAEDVVQDAFVRFWRVREGVDDAPAYLFGCVRRVALERLRGERRRSRREQAAAREEVNDSRWFVKVEDEERRQRIESALQALPAEQREVVVLKTWGRLTFPQIAATLAISENTAASRHRYALVKLRERLTKEATNHA